MDHRANRGQTGRLHNIFCPLSWIAEQKIIVVPNQKWDIPNGWIYNGALFKQSITQVWAISQIAEDAPPA